MNMQEWKEDHKERRRCWTTKQTAEDCAISILIGKSYFRPGIALALWQQNQKALASHQSLNHNRWPFIEIQNNSCFPALPSCIVLNHSEWCSIKTKTISYWWELVVVIGMKRQVEGDSPLPRRMRVLQWDINEPNVSDLWCYYCMEDIALHSAQTMNATGNHDTLVATQYRHHKQIPLPKLITFFLHSTPGKQKNKKPLSSTSSHLLYACVKHKIAYLAASMFIKLSKKDESKSSWI